MQHRKQHKGKAFENISARALVEDDRYYISLKMDGRMNQIAYDGDQTVKFWSAGGHEYYNERMANDIIANNKFAFHVECEYVGESDGKLGDRGKSAIETKYVTAFKKGLASPLYEDETTWVYDILSFDGEDVTQDPFSARHGMLMQLGYNTSFQPVIHTAGCDIATAKIELLNALVAGYEGVMLTHATHVIGTSGRSSLRIKFKETPTGYAKVVGTVPGKDEREGTVGSLMLEDEDGFIFSSGGGLNSAEWVLPPETFVGHTVKYAYESKDGPNYIQCRYLGVCFPPDKTLSRFNEVSK